MIIQLVFIVNRETFRIEVKGNEIWYFDRKWNKSIRLIPKDEKFLKKILLSRNTIPNFIKDMFNLTKQELKEYNQAKNERELADICINDCRMKGAKLLNEEEIEYIKNNKKEILSTLSNERTETKKSEKQARSDMARYKNREINFDNNNGHE